MKLYALTFILAVAAFTYSPQIPQPDKLDKLQQARKGYEEAHRRAVREVMEFGNYRKWHNDQASPACPVYVIVINRAPAQREGKNVRRRRNG